MPVKEKMIRMPKVWGDEVWLVNNEKYCGKLLFLDAGASSSLHLHRVKQETFYCMLGQIGLHIEGRNYMLGPFSRPKTIMPGEKHQFNSVIESVILEISTHHDDGDVERFSESQAGRKTG